MGCSYRVRGMVAARVQKDGYLWGLDASRCQRCVAKLPSGWREVSGYKEAKLGTGCCSNPHSNVGGNMPTVYGEVEIPL